MTAVTENDFVTSADGTAIACTRRGSGSRLVLVHCVGVDRTTTPQPTLPEALAERFTVYTYDRRATGESPTEQPYSVQREVEDLTAVIDLAGGEADVYGFSSGAVLALIAAREGAPIRRLALVEPPLMADALTEQKARLEELMASDRAAARAYYATDVVGVPAEIQAQMPMTEADLANAPSLLHEMEFMLGVTAQDFRGVQQPTLLIRSGHTIPQMGVWAQELVEAMPDAQAVEVPGSWHGADDATLVQTLADFLD